jgi:ABC-2 type transport system ATP-binding protein
MDEAERCHELMYIAAGRALARGTAEAIIGAAGLTVWEVRGERVHELFAPLQAARGVQSVAAFGGSLHVSGANGNALQHAIAPWRSDPGLHWQRVPASLEDVFISLVDGDAAP